MLNGSGEQVQPKKRKTLTYKGFNVVSRCAIVSKEYGRYQSTKLAQKAACYGKDPKTSVKTGLCHDMKTLILLL